MKAFDKIVKVIASSETKDHLISSKRMIINSISIFNDIQLSQLCACLELRMQVLNTVFLNDAKNFNNLAEQMYNSNQIEACNALINIGNEMLNEIDKEI